VVEGNGLMARGKHAQRAENRDWQRMEERIVALEKELATKKKVMHDLQSELLRLRAIEKLFEDKKDVLKELQDVRTELDDAYGRLLVHVERERRWAEIMVHPENETFTKLNPDLAADLVQLGYWPER